MTMRLKRWSCNERCDVRRGDEKDEERMMAFGKRVAMTAHTNIPI